MSKIGWDTTSANWAVDLAKNRRGLQHRAGHASQRKERIHGLHHQHQRNADIASTSTAIRRCYGCLRDVLGMTGTKFGCGAALCGACTVHIDGVATRSCITSIDSIDKSAVTTIEVIGATASGAKIQKAWLDHEVVQCGYCQSGQIMSASALLASNPHPTDADIDDAMSGNICRCGTYVRIREAIKLAAQTNAKGG